ncbi:hypothetical protein [Bacillus thuringiensis]|uniref:hypothetical protein n=1 Tax=Bacillus thuringiensis TaxID=1428 RepID=UPI0016426C11|nr:hypothetical protein [Bacillus thuringiensis]
MMKKYPKFFSVMVLSIFSLLASLVLLPSHSYAATINGQVTVNQVNILDTDGIYFMQSTANYMNLQTKDYTVLDNAIALKEGTLKPENLPKIRVWFDKTNNKIWTLDHRRLISFKLAGIKNISVLWATEDEIKQGSVKMTTLNGGNTINLLFSNSKSFEVERMKDYSVWSLDYLKDIKKMYQN